MYTILVGALARIAVGALLFASIAATAPGRAREGGGIVRIAVVDSLPVPGVRALVMREGRGAQPITIFLASARADVETLGGALAIARRLRAVPLATGRTEVVPVAGVVRRGSLGARAERRLAGILARLEGQPRVRIGNLGDGRWIALPAR